MFVCLKYQVLASWILIVCKLCAQASSPPLLLGTARTKVGSLEHHSTSCAEAVPQPGRAGPAAPPSGRAATEPLSAAPPTACRRCGTERRCRAEPVRGAVGAGSPEMFSEPLGSPQRCGGERRPEGCLYRRSGGALREWSERPGWGRGGEAVLREDGVCRMGHGTGSAAVPQCAVCICMYVDTPCPRAEPQRLGDAASCRPRGNGTRCDGMRNGLLREAADESGSPSPLTAIPPLRGCGTATTELRPRANGPGGLQRFLRRGPQPRRLDSCVIGAGGMPQLANLGIQFLIKSQKTGTLQLYCRQSRYVGLLFRP